MKRVISITDLDKEYNLELDRVISLIKREKAKTVLLQFPDGLKQYSLTVVDYLEEQIPKIELLIWFGTCFGACIRNQCSFIGICCFSSFNPQ